MVFFGGVLLDCSGDAIDRRWSIWSGDSRGRDGNVSPCPSVYPVDGRCGPGRETLTRNCTREMAKCLGLMGMVMGVGAVSWVQAHGRLN